MITRFGYFKTALSGLLLLPAVLSADLEYRGKTAGDEAFRNGDYSAAASFYEQFQNTAQAAGDAQSVRIAMERRIDALILGARPDEAEKLLQAYQQKFPGTDPLAVTMWKADIQLLQKKPDDARRNLERILPALTTDNPRRVHALYSLARAYEQLKNYTAAARLYFSIGQDDSKGVFARKSEPSKLQIMAWERGIYCLAFTSRFNEAFFALADHPDIGDPSVQKRLQLLSSFLMIKTEPKRNLASVWERCSKVNFEKNELNYPIFSAIGDHAAREGLFDIAAEAYALAYNHSPGKEEAFETLRRLLSVIHLSGGKEEAAELVLKILELFKGDYASIKFQEEIAGILYNAGKYQEAAKLYASLSRNPAVPAASKHTAMICLVRISAKDRLPDEYMKLLDGYFSGEKNGERLYYFAETILADKKYKEAIRSFQSVARKYPAWKTRALYQAAYANLISGHPDESLKMLADFFTSGMGGREETQGIYLKARALEDLGKNQEAWQEFERYSQRSDKEPEFSVESLFRGGRLAFLAGKPEKAIQLFNRLIKEYPRSAKSADAANWKIYIFRSLGDDYRADLATYELQTAWPGSQITFDAMYRLAENNFSTDSYSKVIQLLDALFQQTTKPENKARVLCGQAFLSVYHKKYKEAAGYLDRLDSEYPGSRVQTEAAFLRGDIARIQGDYQGAIEYYKKVLTLNPDRYLSNAAMGSVGDCYFILAEKLQNPSAYAEALKAYQKILEQKDLDTGLYAMTLYKAGRSMELMGNDDQALAYYRKTLYLPASFNTPASRLWGAKAAEAIYTIAEKRPIKQHIEEAHAALKLLEKYKIIPAGSAERRTNTLKKLRFRPRSSK